MIKYLLLIVCIIVSLNLSAQKKSLKIEGQIKDINNHPISEATIIIYTAKDSTALKFSHSDLSGKYAIELKGIDQDLILLTKHLSYQEKLTTVPKIKTDTILQKDIQMIAKAFDIEEVIINKFKNPYQINGDTIEFNVEAFRMDSTTVVDDLLKKLPGLIIWSDKKITLNGKEIKKVYVDGKPFFFNDIQFATKNLPNFVVDKIKVYSPTENIMSKEQGLIMDLILKPNKKNGLFGKIGLGAGVNDKQNFDATLATYSPEFRLATVNNYNTINRINESLQDQIVNTSFGNKMSLSSTSKDNYQGVFKSKSHASELAISKKMDYRINYRFNDLENDIIRESILNGIYNKSNTKNQIESSSKIHSLDQSFSKALKKNSNISIQLSYNKNKKNSTENINSDDNFSNKNYRQTSDSQIKNHEDNWTGQINLDKLLKGYNNKKSTLKFGYLFNNIMNDRVANIHLASLITDSRIDSINIKRNENLNTNLFRQAFHGSMENLEAFLRWRKFLKVKLTNDLEIIKNDLKNSVSYFDEKISKYPIDDQLLSYKTDFDQVKFKPSLILEKTWRKERANIYDKYIIVTSDIESILLKSKSRSNQFNHNYRLSYKKFTPSISVKVGKEIIKNYRHVLTINLKKDLIETQFDQMAVLIDTTNLFYRQVPNFKLKPSDTYNSNLSYKYENLKSLGNSIDLAAGYKIIENPIVDSVFLQDEVTQIKFVNANSATEFFFNAKESRTFNIKNFPLKYVIEGYYMTTNNERYVNEKNEKTKNELLRLNSVIFFQIQKKHTLQFAVNYANYDLYSNGQNYNTKLFNYSLASDIAATDRISFLLNLTKKELNSMGSKEILILNMDLIYKAFKNKRSEFKISIYDLFDQNVNLENIQSINGLTSVSTNNLKRYFLLSYSYYLRKF